LDKLRGLEGANDPNDAKGVLRRLREASQPLPPVARAKELIAENGRPFPVGEVPAPAKEATELGQRLFIEKGCLACHSHLGAPVNRTENDERVRAVSDANFGPDLSRIALKLPAGNAGRLWLIQWVLNPNTHHPRTRMPITHLEPREAAAIADWLLSQKDDSWKPEKVAPEGNKEREKLHEALRDLARASLVKTPAVGRQNADDALRKGLTRAQGEALAADADEQALIARDRTNKPRYEDGPIDETRLL